MEAGSSAGPAMVDVATPRAQAPESKGENERVGGRREGARLFKTRRARRGGAHVTSEVSHAALGCCTQSAMKPAQFKFSILPQKFD